VRVLLDQLGVDLHLGRSERGGEVAADCLTRRRAGRGCRGDLLACRLRCVGWRARQGRYGWAIACAARRNRLVLLDPIEEAHPTSGYNAVKWNFASTCFWLTPPAAVIVRHAGSGSVGAVP